MLFKNTDNNYSAVQKLFHWVMALLIIGMLVIGNIMGDLKGPDKLQVYGLHKSTGILILFLAFLRLTWRQVSYQPKIPVTDRLSPYMYRLLHIAADISHFLIYLCMFLMPVTGWAMSSGVGFPVSFYGLFTMPNLISPDKGMAQMFRAAHGYISWVLIVLLSIHIGAALFHHFFLKDNVLKRMLCGSKE